VKRLALALVFAVTLLPVLMAADDVKPQADADGFYNLFDGKSLNGWHINESPETFKVEDGNLVVNGNRSHAFYEGPVADHNFKDFHFKAEVMTMPKSNSGIYFHTKFQPDGWPKAGFEAQVNNTHGDRKKTGGLYAVKDVIDTPPAEDGKWFTYEIIVKGKDVKILIDGKPTTEWTQPADWKAPEGFPGREIGGGTFAIQGHDPVSKVMFRNIKVKPL
jgi:3-keto-disaccharide hydrolase